MKSQSSQTLVDGAKHMPETQKDLDSNCDFTTNWVTLHELHISECEWSHYDNNPISKVIMRLNVKLCQVLQSLGK